MFIVDLTYKVELERVEEFLEQHIQFLNEQYDLGNFVASGRKVPRMGGIILAVVEERDALERILEKDPFKAHQLADYQITEFVPSKTSNELASLLR